MLTKIEHGSINGRPVFRIKIMDVGENYEQTVLGEWTPVSQVACASAEGRDCVAVASSEVGDTAMAPNIVFSLR